MNEQQLMSGRRSIWRRVTVAAVIVATVSMAGVVGATVGVKIQGSGPGKAQLKCPGGMTRLGHEFNEDMSVFPYDPAVEVSDVYTVADDFFNVEAIQMGAHAGTHLDVPAHFVDGGRTVEELAAEEFAWPVYKIDVRGMGFTDNLIEVSDVEAYEAAHGEIQSGSLVVLQTGAEEFFGLGGVGDSRGVTPGFDKDGNPVVLADNVDNLFAFVNPGFSATAVQWMFDQRNIDGVGSDAYGPDAATDVNFDATYTTLINDGVALVALANLDSVSVNHDVVIASVVALSDGSGFSTDPIACHGRP